MYLNNFRSLFLDATKFKLRHVLKTWVSYILTWKTKATIPIVQFNKQISN